MTSDKRYFARRPFQYGSDELDLDQIFTLQGQVNDERLTRLGYCAEVSPRVSIVRCGYCAKDFVTDAALNNHGRKRHGKWRLEEIQAGPAMKESHISEAIATGAIRPVLGDEKIAEPEDSPAMQQEARMAAERPLYMEKTQASVAAGDAPVPEVTTTPKKCGRPRAQAAAGR